MLKPLNALLLIALGISIGFNIYFYLALEQEQSPPAINNQQTNNGHPVNTLSPVQKSESVLAHPHSAESNFGQETKKQTLISQTETWLESRQFDLARDFIQRYLQQNPQDVDFLLLEAQLIDKTTPVSDVLAHYYDLLDYPLNDPQRIFVQQRIDALTTDNINKLKSISAWDILATFLEPLWQFDPDNKSIILTLSESYARLESETLMEYVLASLLPDDPEAIRIRNLLSRATPTETPQPHVAEEINGKATGIPLVKQGDHYLVNTSVEQKRVRLMIDTGATTTVLTQSAFAKLYRNSQSPDFIGQYQVNTAGGRVTAPVFRLSSLSIENYVVQNIAVVVLPMESFEQADGLLGMNYLREFNFWIDQREAQLFLK